MQSFSGWGRCWVSGLKPIGLTQSVANIVGGKFFRPKLCLGRRRLLSSYELNFQTISILAHICTNVSYSNYKTL